MAGRVRWETWCLLVNLGSLGAVGLACHFGIGVHRFRTAAMFLIVGTLCSIYSELLLHSCRARARRQRDGHVPRNVRLRMPLWIAAGGPIMLLAAAEPVAALAGGLGSAQDSCRSLRGPARSSPLSRIRRARGSAWRSPSMEGMEHRGRSSSTNGRPESTLLRSRERSKPRRLGPRREG